MLSKRRKLSPPRSDSEEEISNEAKKLQDSINAMLGGQGSEESDGEGFEDLEDGSEEQEQDSEINEFEDEDLEGSEEDDDMIEDDGIDLMANLDPNDSDSESDEFSDLEIPSDTATPLILKKANVRNSKGVTPLTPAQLRAVAFEELTASPISATISIAVNTFLDPITPPLPATSPLQIILKDLHAHITELPAQKPISLDLLRKKSAVPLVGKFDEKWSKMEFNWEKPRKEDVRIVGSWAWGGAMKGKSGEYVVDLAIGLPQVSQIFSPTARILIIPNSHSSKSRITFHRDFKLNRLITSSLSPLTFLPLSDQSRYLISLSQDHKV